MAKSTPNQIDRSRPSSRLQPQGLLDSTPVLFRLPSVQVHPLPSVGDVSSVALQQAKVDATEPIASEPIAPPVSVVSQPAVAVEAKQSWWEHWSSGIVLIVLLVAMYVTSIVVLKNRSHKPTNTLAEEKSEFGDLANMEVPAIQSSTQATTVSPTIATPGELTPTLVLDSNTNSSAEELASSISNSLTLTNDLATAASPQPVAQAQLLEPTQMPQLLPLLDNSSTLGDSSSLSIQPVSSKNGQSPNLYDGAGNQPESSSQSSVAAADQLTPSQAEIALPSLPVTSGAGLMVAGSEASGLKQPATTSLGPTSLQTQGQSNLTLTNNTVPGYSQSYPQAAPNSTGIPNLVSGAGQQTAVASNMSTVSSSIRQTSTPEANGDVEAIIRAYIEKKRADNTAQQQTNVPTNSFSPSR